MNLFLHTTEKQHLPILHQGKVPRKKDSFWKKILLTASISSSLFALPSFAFNLSTANVSFTLNNFQQIPLSNDTFTDVLALAETGNNKSIANANVEGNLDFIVVEPMVFTQANFLSQAEGEGEKYFSLGQENARAVGEFFLGANEVFSFNFQTSLELNSLVENPFNSSIKTFGSTSFLLLDSNNLQTVFGGFRLSGNLDTNLANNLNNDFLSSQTLGNNIQFTQVQGNRSFGGNNESARATISGFFQQLFTQDTKITLVATTTSRVCNSAPKTVDPCVKVTESSNNFSLILSVIIFGLMSCRVFPSKQC